MIPEVQDYWLLVFAFQGEYFRHLAMIQISALSICVISEILDIWLWTVQQVIGIHVQG